MSDTIRNLLSDTNFTDLNDQIKLFKPVEQALTIDKFSRAVLQNGVLSLLSSFNTLNDTLTITPFLDTPTELFIKSSNIADTMDVKIFYTSQDKILLDKTVTLQGTTEVSVGSDIYSIYRIEVIGTTSHLGTIDVVDGATIYCQIPLVGKDLTTPSNQSLTGIFSVPKDYVALIKYGALSTNKGSDALGAIYTRKLGETFKYKDNLSSYQGSENKRGTLLLDELTDIMPIAQAQTGGITSFSYTILLMKKNLLGVKFKV